MTNVLLPSGDGHWHAHEMRPPAVWRPLARPSSSRAAYAAVHVVADALSDTAPGGHGRLDWDATLAYRHHLWDLGLGVADAMDTAQRNFGVRWETTAELVRRVGEEARARSAPLVCGVATDHLESEVVSLDEVAKAYLLQLEEVEATGATAVIMASRHLARAAGTPEDYATVYRQVLTRASAPVILHWLGPAFDPVLEGYWGTSDIAASTEHVLRLMEEHDTQVAGIKLSLLDAHHEVVMRRRLPTGVRMYSGDDFDYPTLLLGDAHGHSDALLGVFDAIAPAASTALRWLDEGDQVRFLEVLEATVALSRHLFAAPTFHYKTGITFLAWLTGHQDGFAMVGGMSSARSLLHLVETFRLADELGLFADPDLAAHRMRALFAVAGVSP